MKLRRLENGGIPLGYIKNNSDEQMDLSLNSGDILLFLSDGLNEREDPEKQMVDDEQLEQWIDQACRESAGVTQIQDYLFTKCDQFARGRKPTDDMTSLIIRVE